jgi:hypothetical protein
LSGGNVDLTQVSRWLAAVASPSRGIPAESPAVPDTI